MTDRITRLTVVLETDIRKDDCQSIIDAISCIRGVADVSSTVRDFGDYDARTKVRMEVADKLYDVIQSLR